MDWPFSIIQRCPMGQRLAAERDIPAVRNTGASLLLYVADTWTCQHVIPGLKHGFVNKLP
jgi:hypothetical protein